MKRLIYSFGFALRGILSVVKTEQNMRIHVISAIIVIIFGFLFKLTKWEWSIILLCIMMVWVVEIINTVIEKYLDFYHPEKSDKVMILKDMAAGAVLTTAIFSFVIGLIIFVPKFL